MLFYTDLILIEIPSLFSFFFSYLGVALLPELCSSRSVWSIYLSLVYRQVKVRPIDGQLVSGRAANPVMTVCRPWAAFDSAFCDADMMIQRGSRVVLYLQYICYLLSVD